MSKLPVRVAKPALSPTTQAILSLIQGLLPLMTAIAGGLWVAFTYLDNQRLQAEQQRVATIRQDAETSRQRILRQFEARRPFLERQLETYIQTTSVIGKIVTLEPGSKDLEEAMRRFQQLYKGEIPLFGDTTVSLAAFNFDERLFKWEETLKANDPVKQVSAKIDLKTEAGRFAWIIGASIRDAWTIREGGASDRQ